MQLNEQNKKRMQVLAGLKFSLNETHDVEVMNKLEKVIAKLGEKEALTAFIKAMDTHMANNILDYLISHYAVAPASHPEIMNPLDNKNNIADTDVVNTLRTRMNKNYNKNENRL